MYSPLMFLFDDPANDGERLVLVLLLLLLLTLLLLLLLALLVLLVLLVLLLEQPLTPSPLQQAG